MGRGSVSLKPKSDQKPDSQNANRVGRAVGNEGVHGRVETKAGHLHFPFRPTGQMMARATARTDVAAMNADA